MHYIWTWALQRHLHDTHARSKAGRLRPSAACLRSWPTLPTPFARTFALYSLVLLFVLVCRAGECRFAGRCVRCLWDRRSLERTGVWAHTRIITSLPSHTNASIE